MRNAHMIVRSLFSLLVFTALAAALSACSQSTEQGNVGVDKAQSKSEPAHQEGGAEHTDEGESEQRVVKSSTTLMAPP